MTRQKTMLTPEMQWERTVAYHLRLFSPCEGISKRGSAVVIFRGTHALASEGDVFILTVGNGMAQRYGVTGVCSKGARLSDCYLPLRRGVGVYGLPDDFVGRQWTDPDIARHIAHLRARFFNPENVYSPASSHCKTLSGIDTSQIAFNGLYKSARLKGSNRPLDYRIYLRFYPDGSVTETRDFNHQGWRISFDPMATSPTPNRDTPIGRFSVHGAALTMETQAFYQAPVTHSEGEMRDGRLWLRRDATAADVGHATLPYRFHPFRELE